MSRTLVLVLWSLQWACGTNEEVTAPIGPQDRDGDGHFDQEGGGTDCNDDDPAVNIDAQELCDEVDNDCDGEVDEDAEDSLSWYLDGDQDGYGDPDVVEFACNVPTGFVSDSSDCDDAEAHASPAEVEVCDGIDNDCDGAVMVDEVDTDGDLFVPCELASWGWLGAGDIEGGSDCDDADHDVYPNAEELCDRKDNDCDGVVPDEEVDADGDGWSQCLGGDCDDSNPAVNYDTPEVCDDGIDNDCSSDPSGCGLFNSLDADDADLSLTGDLSGENLGTTVFLPGDLDGDGVDDLLVGAPQAGGFGPGAVFLFAGPLSTAAHRPPAGQIRSDAVLDGMGLAIGGGVDLDGDGFGEVVAGAGRRAAGPTSDGHEGRVWLFGGPVVASVAPEDARLSITGDGDSFMGDSVAISDGLGPGGKAALVAGAPCQPVADQTCVGAVYLFGGLATGAITLDDAEAELLGDDENDHFGRTLHAGTDLTGDGIFDLVVGATGATGDNDQSGAVYVFAGPITGHPSTTDADAVLLGRVGGDSFGTSLSTGDLDGDGATDLVVGAPGSDDAAEGGGAAWVTPGPLGGHYDSRSSSHLAIITGSVTGLGLGHAVASGGDLDGDGLDDLALASDPDVGDGWVLVFNGPVAQSSSADAAGQLTGTASAASFGVDVALGPDLLGTGHGTLVVGASDLDAGSGGEGGVLLFSSGQGG